MKGAHIILLWCFFECATARPVWLPQLKVLSQNGLKLGDSLFYINDYDHESELKDLTQARNILV